jgi:hypothetical protein
MVVLAPSHQADAMMTKTTAVEGTGTDLATERGRAVRSRHAGVKEADDRGLGARDGAVVMVVAEVESEEADMVGLGKRRRSWMPRWLITLEPMVIVLVRVRLPRRQMARLRLVARLWRILI